MAAAPTPASDIAAQLRAKFRDFDKKEVFEEIKKDAADKDARNFAVQFGPDRVEVALNLDAAEVAHFLQSKKQPDMPIRWINIWDPSKQEDVVQKIGNHYQFSSRLTKSITIWDPPKKYMAKAAAAEAAASKSRQGSDPRRATFPRDVEQGLNGQAANGVALSTLPAGAPKFCPEDIEMFRLIHRALNYTTIDHGQRFICIGANWLHARPDMKADKKDGHHEGLNLVPPKHWTWFALTNEHTVLSFQEAPYYDCPEGVDPASWEPAELKNMRSNTHSLLTQLSDHGRENKFASSKAVRLELKMRNATKSGPRAPTTMPESSIEIEGATNLFYYLFEDYSAAVAILNKSNEILGQLTKDVLHITDRKNKGKDTSDIIRKLYDLSRELRQLEHLFESYAALIQRITALGVETSENLGSSMSLQSNTREVKLSQTAFDRFERLNDRLKLLMLSSIQECLDEKTSLSDTYFNLLSQNDSQATSRLTRSATLLAKLSVFFLPISFITSYFSVQIPDLTDNYTGRTYWGTFAVVAAVSFISLFFFSRVLEFLSDVLEERAHGVEDWIARRRPWGWRGRGPKSHEE